MYEEQMDETSSFDETRLKNLINKIQLVDEVPLSTNATEDIIPPADEDFDHLSGTLSAQEEKVASEIDAESFEKIDFSAPTDELDFAPVPQTSLENDPPSNPDEEIPLWKKLQHQVNEGETNNTESYDFSPVAGADKEDKIQFNETVSEEAFTDSPYQESTLTEPSLSPEIDVPDFGVPVTTEVVGNAGATDENIPLWLKFQQGDSASVQTQTTEEDFSAIERTVLGKQNVQHRTWFLSDLFDGAQEDYEAALHKLHGAPTWTRASQIINDDIFSPRNINIYAEVAVTFTDAVESSYRTY